MTSFEYDGFDKVLGLQILSATEDEVVGRFEVRPELLQPYGLLHGGANATLAEALGSICAALNANGRAAMGLELACTHHRAVREGSVTGVAVPVHVGRGTITSEIVITDDQGRRTCTAKLTCIIRDIPPGAGAQDA